MALAGSIFLCQAAGVGTKKPAVGPHGTWPKNSGKLDNSTNSSLPSGPARGAATHLLFTPGRFGPSVLCVFIVLG